MKYDLPTWAPCPVCHVLIRDEHPAEQCRAFVEGVPGPGAWVEKSTVVVQQATEQATIEP